MGWAKYYEDNVSICIGRMAVKEYIPVKPTPVRAHRIDRRIEISGKAYNCCSGVRRSYK